MNYEKYIHSKVIRGEEASISLGLLEDSYPPEIPAMRAIHDWAVGICKRIGCDASIHMPSNVITFYPVVKQ